MWSGSAFRDWIRHSMNFARRNRLKRRIIRNCCSPKQARFSTRLASRRLARSTSDSTRRDRVRRRRKDARPVPPARRSRLRRVLPSRHARQCRRGDHHRPDRPGGAVRPPCLTVRFGLPLGSTSGGRRRLAASRASSGRRSDSRAVYRRRQGHLAAVEVGRTAGRDQKPGPDRR